MKKKLIGGFLIASFVIGVSVFGLFLRPEKASSCAYVPCPDFTGDGWVSLSDFSFFVEYYNLENGQGKLAGGTYYNNPADLNLDGKVDEADLAIFESYYNGPFVCGEDVIEY